QNFGGQTSGDGDFIKSGESSLTLTAANSADWTIEEGLLVATAGQYSGDAEILAGGEFRLTGGAAIYDGILSGNGAFLANTDDRLTLTGDSSDFSGATEVLSGQLHVAEQLGGD